MQSRKWIKVAVDKNIIYYIIWLSYYNKKQVFIPKIQNEVYYIKYWHLTPAKKAYNLFHY